MRPVLIGEAYGRHRPGTISVPLFPVPRGAAGDRLCRMMGLTRGQYLAGFDRVNLVPSDTWSVVTARNSVEALLPVLAGRRVLLLGAKVMDCFGVGGRPWMEWTHLRRMGMAAPAHVVGLPHPSGRNRLYNDAAFKTRVEKFLRDEFFPLHLHEPHLC